MNRGLDADMKRSRIALAFFVSAIVFTLCGLIYVGFFFRTPPSYHTFQLLGEGYNIARLDASGNRITRGSNFHFTIVIQNGWEGTPVVRINGTRRNPNEDGVFSVWNVRRNQTIDVSGLNDAPVPRLARPFAELWGDLVSWSPVTGASGFTVSIHDIERNITTTHNVGAGTTTFNLFYLNLQPGEYEIRVRANVASGSQFQESYWSITRIHYVEDPNIDI